MRRIIGYGLTTKGEADRYMEDTLKEFLRLCDDTIILCNNAGDKEKELIQKYGFKMVEDNREWGLFQNKIKEDFVKNHVAKLNPTHCIVLDMDEIFEERVNRSVLEQLNMSGAYFWFVQHWDSVNKHLPALGFWNVRFYEFHPQSIKFQNTPLHCGLSPEYAYFYGGYAPYIVRHFGLKNRSDRMKKVERYQKYDPNAKYKDKSYYDMLASEDAGVPYDEDVEHEKVANEVGKYQQKYKPISEIKNMKFYYVQNPAGRIVDIPERNLEETLARPGFKLIGEIVTVSPEEAPVVVPEKTENPLECSICGTIAKTTAGLKAHQRKHAS
jgi:hypothetical protein